MDEEEICKLLKCGRILSAQAMSVTDALTALPNAIDGAKRASLIATMEKASAKLHALGF